MHDLGSTIWLASWCYMASLHAKYAIRSCFHSRRADCMALWTSSFLMLFQLILRDLHPCDTAMPCMQGTQAAGLLRASARYCNISSSCLSLSRSIAKSIPPPCLAQLCLMHPQWVCQPCPKMMAMQTSFFLSSAPAVTVPTLPKMMAVQALRHL